MNVHNVLYIVIPNKVNALSRVNKEDCYPKFFNKCILHVKFFI